MSLSWSKDDSLFVCHHDYSIWQFDLKASSPSEPLQGTHRSKATYDGRKSQEFLNFLSKTVFLVNRQGRIIYSPNMKKGESHNGYLLDAVLSLGYFGIQSVSQQPLSKSAEVTELHARLNNANADLEKKNNLLNKSQGQIDSIKAELATKNDLLKESKGQLNNVQAELEKKNDLLKESQSQLNNVKAELAKKNDLLQSQLNNVVAELTRNNDLLKELQSQLNDIKAVELDEMKKKKKKNAGLNLKEAKFDPPRTLVKTDSNFLGFLRRMNRTFVNPAGNYLKFDFIGIDAASVSSCGCSETLNYCDQDCWISCPFKLLQFDENEPQQQIIVREFYEPGYGNVRENGNPGTWLVNEALRKAGNNSLSCGFAIGRFRFIGQITKTCDTFLNNALVSVFFDQSQHGEYCFVDALATTFFVLETEKQKTWDAKPLGKPPCTC